MTTETPHAPWRHRFAVFTAAATLALLGAGGLVTSHGVGMAVPDWPNTYGYNMFFFPVSRWVGGIFYEHTHRLIASGVGLCTVILAIWLQGPPARRYLRWGGLILLAGAAVTGLLWPQRRADSVVLALAGGLSVLGSPVWPCAQPAAPWLRRLGLLAVITVILQGVLGGLRVVLFKDEIGIFHAALAQLFFVLTCALAMYTSKWWQAGARQYSGGIRQLTSAPRPMILTATILILAQLVLGAAMRHQHAGLAIPDFPLAYGKLWPAMDAASLARYNQQRLEITATNDITAAQIGLQIAHRALALVIFAAVAASAWQAQRQPGTESFVKTLCSAWLGLIFIQALLGAATIWSNKAADVATAHVLIGALALGLGGVLSMITFSQSSLGPDLATTPTASSQPIPQLDLHVPTPVLK